MSESRAITEYDAHAPALLRHIARNKAALPAARARHHMYEDAGRAAHPDYAASADLAHGLCAAGVRAAEEMLVGLDSAAPAWRVVGGTRVGGTELPDLIVQTDPRGLHVRYGSDRFSIEISQISTRRDATVDDLQAHRQIELVRDGRSVGSAWIAPA